MQTAIRFLALALFPFAFLGSSFMYYKAGDSCRSLNSIATDKDRNLRLRVELETFINSGSVLEKIESDLGRVLNVDYLGNSAQKIKVLEEEVGTNDLQIFLSRNSSREITHIGIGYARGYILYKLDNMTQDKVYLTNDSKIKCVVYRNE